MNRKTISLIIAIYATTFEGNFFKVKDAALSKKQLQIPHSGSIPITIAAKQDRTMRIAAMYAQVWESSYLTPEQFTILNKKFESIFNKANGNGDRRRRITRSIELDVLISESESELEYKKKIFAMERAPAVANQMLKHGLIGTPEQINIILRSQDPENHLIRDREVHR